MTTSILSIAELAPVGLSELLDEAAMLTRVDRKYLLSVRDASSLVDSLDPRTRVLTIDERRCFAYESTYFDTDGLLSFQQAAHRRRRRFKVRSRDYLDARTAYLEVKTRGRRGVTVKDRIDRAPGARLSDLELGFIRERVGDVADDLVPTLTTRYARTTLLPPEPDVRVTLDTDLIWDDGTSGLTVPDLVIVETKGGTRPSEVDRLLWRAGHRPQSVSKYATGLAALRPQLTANPWARVIRRHLTTSAEVACAA